MTDDNPDDFASALTIGLQAATRADAAKKEIFDVFSSLEKAIELGTGGILSLALVNPRETHSKLGLAAIALSAMSQVRTPHTDPEEEADAPKELVVRVPEKSSFEYTRKLCSIEFTRGEYPVKIDGPGGLSYCSDDESLRLTLAGVLKHPQTGRKIQSLVEMAQRASLQSKRADE